MPEEEGGVYMFLLYYIKKDNFISTYLIVKSAFAIASISKFENNDTKLTKFLKGLINCLGNVSHYEIKCYKNQIIILPNIRPGT